MNYCKKCGTELPTGAVCCPNCGEKPTEAPTAAVNSSASQAAPTAQPSSAYRPTAPNAKMDIMAIMWFAVGGLVLLLSVIAGFMIMGGAGDMATLRSVGGSTVAEAFYQYSGAVNKGIAVLTFAFGFFGAGIFARFGFKELKK